MLGGTGCDPGRLVAATDYYLLLDCFSKGIFLTTGLSFLFFCTRWMAQHMNPSRICLSPYLHSKHYSGMQQTVVFISFGFPYRSIGNHLLDTQETYQFNKNSIFNARKMHVFLGYFLNMAGGWHSQFLFTVHMGLMPGPGIWRGHTSKTRKLLHEWFNQINHGKVLQEVLILMQKYLQILSESLWKSLLALLRRASEALCVCIIFM